MAAGLASGSFAVLIGGSPYDFLSTILSGLLVNLSLSYVQQGVEALLTALSVAVAAAIALSSTATTWEGSRWGRKPPCWAERLLPD